MDELVDEPVPGEYLFELQLRDEAGNWSSSVESSTRIVSVGPSGVELFLAQDFSSPYAGAGADASPCAPGSVDTSASRPSFRWTEPFEQPGQLDPQAYQVRFEQFQEGEWKPKEEIDSEALNQTTSTEWAVPAPLGVGCCRLSVAVWNVGGLSEPVSIELRVAPQITPAGFDDSHTNDPSPEFRVTGVDNGELIDTYQWVINGTPAGEAFDGSGTPGTSLARGARPQRMI
ncbi:MAG: hypothetical protein ACLFS5_13680 [Spirochaetaceae bacterium]